MAFFQSLVEFIETVFLSSNPDVKIKLDIKKIENELKMIQEKYKSNPQLMQQKMMEFYKEHKFNPMAGCFPLLIQMPIFILLYSTLKSIISSSSTKSIYINSCFTLLTY